MFSGKQKSGKRKSNKVPSATSGIGYRQLSVQAIGHPTI